MRSPLLVLAALALAALSTVSGASLAPNVCDSSAVQLELRPSQANQYELAFVAIDPHAGMAKADFIDIHYRVNNEDSVNLRVGTETALTSNNERAKQAQVDGIQLDGGDVIRAYATYSVAGIACDTAIHTFNAPEPQRSSQRMAGRTQQKQQADLEAHHAAAAEDHFWTQAAVQAEMNHAAGACPAIAMDQNILKQAGSQNAYVLSFENKTPGKQLHYVDLHIANDADQGWDNLRLASDMQLDLAHKVMQPGVVIKANKPLSWYWSYRTAAADGSNVIDCSSPITTINANEVTHEVDLGQIVARA